MPIVYKPGLALSEIAKLKLELNNALPDEHGDFLQKMNGFFLTAPDYVQIPLSSIDEGSISFDRMFGWLPDDECNDVVAFNNEFIEELDFLEEAIAIGEDGGGNPYVIVNESNRGGVYYWDRTHLHDGESISNVDIPEQNDCGNLYLVSSNFDEFYKMILQLLGGDPNLIAEL